MKLAVPITPQQEDILTLLDAAQELHEAEDALNEDEGYLPPRWLLDSIANALQGIAQRLAQAQ